MIAAGKRRHCVLIQQQTDEQDDAGEKLEQWNDLRSTWAEIRAVTSKEVYAASGFTSQVSHLITILFHPSMAVRSSYRVVYRGRIFQVQAVVDEDETQVELKLYCLELGEGIQR
jgi:SPP1 family predicted phage head-tail adaptor